MSNSNISQKNIKILWSRTAGICSFTDCNINCIQEVSGKLKVIGEMAHIYAGSCSGPRANNSLSLEYKKSHQNLILLCPTHHTLIDKAPEEYTAEKLIKMKKEHEISIQQKLDFSMLTVGFKELKHITERLMTVNQLRENQTDLSILHIREKIKKNDLSPETQRDILTGYIKINEVKNFLKEQSTIEPNFSEYLKKGLVEKYNEFSKKGLKGNEIFNEMRYFCSLGSNNFEQMSAGLTVLVYFFETCDIFKK